MADVTPPVGLRFTSPPQPRIRPADPIGAPFPRRFYTISGPRTPGIAVGSLLHLSKHRPAVCIRCDRSGKWLVVIFNCRTSRGC